MAKMKMSVRERPRVKAECLRLLASLKLDPARTKLIGGFVDSYLKLNAQEMKQFERAVDKFAPTERIATMEITTSWERMGLAQGLAEGLSQGLSQGISQGLTQGKETLVARQLRCRLGTIPSDLVTRLDTLTPDQLDDLGEALLDFTTTADLEQWFAQHQ